MDPKIALLLEMERSVWSHFWQNLTGLTEEEYRWRPLPQANDINWILRHLAGYERYCGNIVRAVDVGRGHWPDAPFPQAKRDLEELAADYQQAIAPLRWDDLTYQVPYGPGAPGGWMTFSATTPCTPRGTGSRSATSGGPTRGSRARTSAYSTRARLALPALHPPGRGVTSGPAPER